MLEETNKGYESEVNLSYLRDIASGSVEFMIEMIDIFLDQTPEYFRNLETAVAEKNWKGVADVAHKIKPTLAFMGVNSGKQDIEDIEHKARDGRDVEEIQVQFNTLKEKCSNLFLKLQQVRTELEAEL
ncbi:MAG TPA: Hpt domain-containing protein [Sphingobacteriaceae bacterium]